MEHKMFMCNNNQLIIYWRQATNVYIKCFVLVYCVFNVYLYFYRFDQDERIKISIPDYRIGHHQKVMI